MEDYKGQFTIVPIMVGSLSIESEALYGEILAPYLADPENLFVISSDFCHWGQRFRYTYFDKSFGPIHKSIENLDKTVRKLSVKKKNTEKVLKIIKKKLFQGMNIIETLNPTAFSDYLKKYNNTICGRHPIGVLLQAVKCLDSRGYKMNLKFLQYAQSSQCYHMSDSSVSYAAGSLVFD